MKTQQAFQRPSVIAAAVLSVVVLSACDTIPPTHKPETAVYVHHVYKPVTPPLSPLDDPNSVLARRSVYFDSNSVELKASDRVLLQAHADYMRSSPTARMRVEGHADFRGTSDFNQSLGFRRAEVVRNYLRQNGVADSALEVMSYGKDNPVDSGRSEDSRSRNRRVDLRYLAR